MTKTFICVLKKELRHIINDHFSVNKTLSVKLCPITRHPFQQAYFVTTCLILKRE